MKVEKSNLAEVAISYNSKVKPTDRALIKSAADAYEILKSIYNENTVEHHEVFILVLLNRANRVLGWVKVSQGGIQAALVDVRIVFQYALLANAVQIMVSHNHPSGQSEPSDEDKRLTKKLVEAGKLLDVRILDHIIYTKHGYYSFAENAEL